MSAAVRKGNRFGRIRLNIRASGCDISWIDAYVY